jgi:hypothetical protein
VDLVHLTLNDLHYYHYGPSGPPHYLSSYLTFQELEAMLKTKNINQKSRLRKKRYTRMTMEQKTRVKVFQVWSRKLKKKDKHHTTTKKAKMKAQLMSQLLKLCCNDVSLVET